MKYASCLLMVVLLAGGVCWAQSISITGPDQSALVEKHTYRITWNSEQIDKVSIVVYGDRTPLGARSRGDFLMVVANAVPADAGGIEWSVPWIDSIAFTIKAKGFDSTGREVTQTEHRTASGPWCWKSAQPMAYISTFTSAPIKDCTCRRTASW